MLRIPSLRSGLPIFKALSSETRLSIMELLQQEGPLNITAISDKLGLTLGTLSPHIRALQDCGLISVSMTEGRHGTMKICSAAAGSILIASPELSMTENMYETEIGIGQYTNYEVRPTCGICTTDHIIGKVDVPACFSDMERNDAHILWFASGYVEYMLPCFLKEGQEPLELQLSMEISSEAPGVQENWPSDIHFQVNGVDLGFWTSPGDYGEIHGRFTPSWWDPNWNQYGLLKLLSINEHGTYMDGRMISPQNIHSLNLDHESELRFRLAAPADAVNTGGCTLFGRGFGNYNQGLKFNIIYTEE